MQEIVKKCLGFMFLSWFFVHQRWNISSNFQCFPYTSYFPFWQLSNFLEVEIHIVYKWMLGRRQRYSDDQDNYFLRYQISRSRDVFLVMACQFKPKAEDVVCAMDFIDANTINHFRFRRYTSGETCRKVLEL